MILLLVLKEVVALGGDGTHNVMSVTQLSEARTGKYLVMNKFADSETKPSRLDVDFNSLYTDIKNKLVGEGFGQGGGKWTRWWSCC